MPACACNLQLCRLHACRDCRGACQSNLVAFQGAFPCLSQETASFEVDVNETEKSREKPTFSSVAAGRRKEKKEPKEKKSYAQTLKQNNGLIISSLLEFMLMFWQFVINGGGHQGTDGGRLHLLQTFVFEGELSKDFVDKNRKAKVDI